MLYTEVFCMRYYAWFSQIGSHMSGTETADPINNNGGSYNSLKGYQVTGYRQLI